MLLDISFLRIVIYILMCLSWLSLLPFANGNTSLRVTSLWIFITFLPVSCFGLKWGDGGRDVGGEDYL
jgi:hypothetical protein